MNTDILAQRPKAAKSGPEKSPLTAKSRGRGWDCVRQMQMFRQRPDVLAAALHDMGFSESGDELPDSDEAEVPPTNYLN